MTAKFAKNNIICEIISNTQAYSTPSLNLLFITFFFIFFNAVELQSVLVLFNSNKSDPVSDLVLLQVSLCQVLQVFTWEFGVWNNNNLVWTFSSDWNVITQVTNNVVNLDVFNKVLDVTFLVKDTVFNWSWSVNGELLNLLGFLSGLGRRKKNLLAYRISFIK